MSAVPAPIALEELGLPGFRADTTIATTDGPLPAGWILPGHRVLTTGGGTERVARVAEARHAGTAEDAPAVIVPAGALGPGVPARSVSLLPGHVLGIAHPLAELYFGARRVLVEARHLAGLNGIALGTAALAEPPVHLLLDRAALVDADGLASAAPGPCGGLPDWPKLDSMEARVMAAALAFPEEAGRRIA